MPVSRVWWAQAKLASWQRKSRSGRVTKRPGHEATGAINSLKVTNDPADTLD